MEIAFIGLGKMGARMAERCLQGKHRVFGYDISAASREALNSVGGVAASSLKQLAEQLPTPRILWLMLPAGEVIDNAISELLPLLSAGDVLCDGGNSLYKDSLERAKRVEAHGCEYLDIGTSGGVWGLSQGYSLMIGGKQEVVESLRPIFETLAPAPDRGWGRVGSAGAGHFTKMIHNGIEYGLMQAYAEGFSILEHKKQFDFDLEEIAEIWQHGSVVRSWLLDLIKDALQENPSLDQIKPWVSDSGEGRWTVSEAIDLDVPAPVITLALLQRLRSRDEQSFGDRLLAAMRNQFGGHAIKKEDLG